MSSIKALLAELDERRIAREVALPHDEARLSFPLRSNTVGSLDEFTDVTGRYLQHHFGCCVARGLPRVQASGRAKDILNKELHRQGGDFFSAYQDCRDSVNGGVRHVLDVICESVKEEAIEYYMRDAFDRHLPPASDDWAGRKAMVRQFIEYCGVALPDIDSSDPGRYARDLEPLIRAFLRGLRQMSSIFRRL